MLTIAQEKTRALNSNCSPADGWKGASRSLDLNGLEVGDILIFPKKYEGDSAVMNDNRFKDRDGNPAQFVLIPTEAGGCRRVYASTFSKTRQIYEQVSEGVIRPTGQTARVTGTAVELVQSTQGTLKDQMEALLGKKIKVSNIIRYKTRRFINGQISNELSDSQFPVLDIVEK